MHRFFSIILGLLTLMTTPLSAETADEIIQKYVKTVGGMDRIGAVQTLRKTGIFTGGGGFEAAVVEENKRPAKVRQEFSLQGLTGVNAYDGKNGWKVEPWQGKKDPEPLGEEELKQIVEDSDFDGPLVNYQQKGNKVEYVGMEEVDGTDSHKLKITTKNGDVRLYYMDTDYFVPIKIELKRMVRGAEREYETELGEYKEVNGWYLPHSIESGVKGSPFKQKVTWLKIEANAPIADSRFAQPGAKPEQPQLPDASEKKSEKPTTPAKPPAGGAQ